MLDLEDVCAFGESLISMDSWNHGFPFHIANHTVSDFILLLLPFPDAISTLFFPSYLHDH